MGLKFEKLSKSKNEKEVDENCKDQSCLGFGLELKFGVIIKLAKKVGAKEMLSKYFDDALFDIQGGLVTEYQRQTGERELDEPSGPPWNVISGVNKEISGLSLVAGELESISD